MFVTDKFVVVNDPEEQQLENEETADIGSDTGEINPAWNDLLNVIPEDTRDSVIPHLRRWDSNYSEMQQRYSGFDDFVKQGIDPGYLQQAVQAAQLLTNNPRRVYDMIVDRFGNDWGIGQSQQPAQQSEQTQLFEDVGSEQGFDITQHPKFIEQQNQLQMITDVMAQQIQAQQAQEADKRLAKDIADLQDKYKDKGPFDEKYVIGLAASGIPLDKAVETYYSTVEKWRAENRQPSMPRILAPGGGVPSTSVDPTKLSGKDTRSLVAQLLEQS